MPRRIELVEFLEEDPGSVLVVMDELAQAGAGWINVQPAVREEDVPPAPTGISAWFSATADDFQVPVGTWLPGKVGRRGREPDSLGLRHATGPKTALRLAPLGAPVPEGWRRVQDHPRRGLVVRPGVGTSHAAELEWLLRAGTALSMVRLTGEWRAEVHRR